MIERPQILPLADITAPIGNDRATGTETPSFADWLARMPQPSRRELPQGLQLGGTPESLPEVAKIFNQNGFFAGAPDAVDTNQAILPATCSADAPKQIHSFDSPGTGDLARALTNGGTSNGVPTGLSDAPSVARPVIAQRLPQPAAQAGPAAATTEIFPSLELDTHAGPEVHGTSRRLFAPLAQARSALRIAIRDLDHGLQIIVAANTLSVQERERLASEIAGLLSRHGLIPSEVRVAGIAEEQARKGE